MIIVEGKVKGKGRPRKGKKGFYTPNDTKCYENYIKAEYIRQSNIKYDGPIKIIINVYRKRKYLKREKEIIEKEKYYCQTKPDLDNVIKAVLDALNNVAYEDDNQVSQIIAEKIWTLGEERIEFKLEQL